MCRTIPNISSEAIVSASEAGQHQSHGVIALTSDDIVLITSMQVHQRQTEIPVNFAHLPIGTQNRQENARVSAELPESITIPVSG